MLTALVPDCNIFFVLFITELLNRHVMCENYTECFQTVLGQNVV
jgi:hypothetical protein